MTCYFFIQYVTDIISHDTSNQCFLGVQFCPKVTQHYSVSRYLVAPKLGYAMTVNLAELDITSHATVVMCSVRSNYISHHSHSPRSISFPHCLGNIEKAKFDLFDNTSGSYLTSTLPEVCESEKCTAYSVHKVK